MTQKKLLTTQPKKQQMIRKKLLNKIRIKFNLYAISGKGFDTSLAFRVSTGGNNKCKL
ncbi:hypothetical protein Blut17040_21580 [Blautia luti]|nr:hypothetical protein Blut17040_21580 [Blautia luti]